MTNDRASNICSQSAGLQSEPQPEGLRYDTLEDTDDSDNSELNYLSIYVDNLHPTFDIFDDDSDAETHVRAEEEDFGRNNSMQDSLHEEQDVSNVVSTIKKCMPRPVLLAIISLYGKCRYTLENYEHLVAMIRDVSGFTMVPGTNLANRVSLST